MKNIQNSDRVLIRRRNFDKRRIYEDVAESRRPLRDMAPIKPAEVADARGLS